MKDKDTARQVIITGGQYGSEGKGSFCHHLMTNNPYEMAVRVGGPQAGHSVRLDDGAVLKFQSLPVGCLRPGTISIVGMAAVADPGQIMREMNWVRETQGFTPMVVVDYRATALTLENVQLEKESDLTERLGSTSHGVGRARADRIMRTAPTVADITAYFSGQVMIDDTTAILRQALVEDRPIMIEGAQGHELSLFSSALYPYVTSNECGPTQAFADTGLPLNYAEMFRRVAVFRTYPIRVAGHSGALPQELSWDALRELHGDHIPDEQTTVTKKLRRVAQWDSARAWESVRRHGIERAVLTFLDYPFPDAEGVTDWNVLSEAARAYVRLRERQLGVPVVYVGTSFGTYAVVPPAEGQDFE